MERFLHDINLRVVDFWQAHLLPVAYGYMGNSVSNCSHFLLFAGHFIGHLKYLLHEQAAQLSRVYQQGKQKVVASHARGPHRSQQAEADELIAQNHVLQQTSPKTGRRIHQELRENRYLHHSNIFASQHERKVKSKLYYTK